MYFPKEKKRYIKNDTLLTRKRSCDTVTVTETEVIRTFLKKKKRYIKNDTLLTRKPSCDTVTVTETEMICSA